MQILAYLKYLPFLVQLVTFIRQAEAVYKGKGKGIDKLTLVTGQFANLINGAESVGLISAKLAATLRDGSTVIITVIVDLMNATGGVLPELPPLPVEGKE